LLPVVGLMLLPFRTFSLAFFLFGFSWAGANAQWALNDRLARRSMARLAGSKVV
jgi:hypothetical protein